MPAALIEVVSGVVDGFNNVFQTAQPYVTGSVQVFVDGQLRRQDYDDGWVEMGGKKIALKVPPKIGCCVQAYYRPA